jgi:hypothetical protein
MTAGYRNCRNLNIAGKRPGNPRVVVGWPLFVRAAEVDESGLGLGPQAFRGAGR